MNTTPYAAFLAQYAPPSPPAAASLDLDAGAVIRLKRRPDDAGYEVMTLSAKAPAPPTPQPPAKPGEPTITPVSRRGPLYVQPATKPVTRARAAKHMRAVSVRRASMRPR